VHQPELNNLLAAAEVHLSAHRLGAAAEAYQAVLAAEPNHAVALHGLGWIAHLSGDRAQAVSLLRRSIDAEPANAGCWNNLGIVYAADQRPAEAVEAYHRAIAVQPNFPQAYLNLGNAMRDQGRWQEAVGAYGDAVRLKPNFAAAHHALGTALRESGRAADAVASYRRAMQLDPSSAGSVLNDLGLTFARVGNVVEAVAHLRQALSLAPQDPKPRRNLGRMLLRAGRFAEAAEVLAPLAQSHPGAADVHHDLAAALAQSGRVDAAIGHFRRAVELRPDYAEAYCNLGVALEERGDVAAAAYGRARELRPDLPVIAYHHGALAGRDAPPTCPPQYVVELFDRYAERFDEHLVKKLSYAGPQLLYGAVSGVTQRRDLEVIDLGCGTGLCGVLFRPVASKLVGVDLSPKMLEQSRRRGVYDELVKADVVEALRARPESADVILAADVFIYVGELTAAFDAARWSLKPGGLFAFTVESIADADGEFVLRATRRYAHSAAYLRRLASAAGLEELTATRVVLRAGEEAPVGGMVFVLRRP
jgi:predicted TPR repeat methyltransferase